MPQRSDSLGVEQVPRIGQRHRLPLVPVQERNPQILFKTLDLGAEARLRDPQAICRLRKVKLFRHGEKALQLAHVDHCFNPDM
ncbi:hypothetical protein D9M68_461170 [compost metagenome]